MHISLNKTPMPEQEAHTRSGNFEEVALGYTEELARTEAARCLQCKTAPCRQGCPVEIDIPRFIKQIQSGDFSLALQTIKEVNRLPAICGRVCPQEDQCEKYCILRKKGEAVAIGRLERYVADRATKEKTAPAVSKSKQQQHKVAVVGSGPASLTVAGDLAQKGYQVTVFEALHLPGGVLMYGIPEFRLPKEIVQTEIYSLCQLGVHFETNVIIGRTFTVDELMEEEGFSAVFIGTGAGLPYFMNIPGENLNGVYSANEFLTRCNLMKAYQFPTSGTPIHVGDRVAVIGGGNVAMDAARTALRLGAKEVSIVYRRSEEELPARLEESHHAKEEGIRFQLLTAPLSIEGKDGWVTGLTCIRMQLGEADSSGRRRPIEIPNSEFMLPTDTIIIAIGQGANPLIQSTTQGMATNPKGNIITDLETGMTTKPGVFAGGDIVTGAATVILAMGAGKKAAVAIDRYLQTQQ